MQQRNVAMLQNEVLADHPLVPRAAPDGGGRQDEAGHVAPVGKEGARIPQDHHLLKAFNSITHREIQY